MPKISSPLSRAHSPVMARTITRKANKDKQKVVVHRLDSLPRPQNPRVCFPWRSRKCRHREDLSEQQKKELKEAWVQKKQDLRSALRDAHDVIWDLAGKDGGHVWGAQY